eukprot:SAG11_NODE_22539_length_404_cov_0.842623_1_plen_58_part_00
MRYGQISMLVDQMVDHAMRYASVSEEHLYSNEFAQVYAMTVAHSLAESFCKHAFTHT